MSESVIADKASGAKKSSEASAKAQPADEVKAAASASPENFIACMRRLAGSVNIITSADGDVWAGLTATAVTSLTAHPPRILCCVNQKGVTMNVIRNTRNFCVNVLSVEDRALAERFAGMGDIGGEDRFAEGLWEPLATGAPALKNALAAVDCSLEKAIEYDSHAIVVGRVKATHYAKDVNPLLWVDGAFATAKAWEDA